MSNQVLAPVLNERILKQVKLSSIQYSVADVAPDTYQALAGRATDTLVVWAGGSDATIYGAPEVNWAFRAWHDSIHLLIGAGFDTAGETLVARFQAAQLSDAPQLGDILIAEVTGQAEYFARFGAFPSNQVDFVKAYLAGQYKNL